MAVGQSWKSLGAGIELVWNDVEKRSWGRPYLGFVYFRWFFSTDCTMGFITMNFTTIWENTPWKINMKPEKKKTGKRKRIFQFTIFRFELLIFGCVHFTWFFQASSRVANPRYHVEYFNQCMWEAFMAEGVHDLWKASSTRNWSWYHELQFYHQHLSSGWEKLATIIVDVSKFEWSWHGPKPYHLQRSSEWIWQKS